MNKLTLRMRITVLVGLIVVAIAMLLTAASITGANNYFVGKELHKSIVNDPEKGQQLHEEIMGNGQASGYFEGISVEMKVIEAQRKFSIQSILVMVVIVIVGIMATYIMVGRALKPLSNLSETIKDISERNLSKRIDVPLTKDEVGSLSTSFNSMLDRLDRSFTRQKRFAANAAHELKTPLATIKASVQVLHLDENPSLEDYKANAEEMQQSTERLITVVDDLLKLALEDRTDFNDDVSLRTMFEDISDELESLADKNQVKIVIHDCDCNVKCNKSLLYRAIFNLAANAVKYNKQGGRVDLLATQENHSVVITVRDQGIGISEDEISNIFEPFYRIDKSRSREFTGSGLGLSIVKTIVEKHNGTIDIQSAEDIGTVVNVSIPVRTDS
ncbi:sensor histidine kinase [Paenibacillus sp. EC2-1]|uniref:sensor histidine kinase n=1 Tax=Paenibacillus sp. EC2-1 TaxID=3388665 RepID=UPI003BEEC7E5